MKATITIKKNSEFRRMYSRGRSAATPLMVLYVRHGPNPKGNRIGITVSTKVGKAVVRNNLRRRFREIFRLNKEKLVPGYDVIIVARVKSRFADYHELERDYLYLAEKLGVISKNEKTTDFSC